MAQALTSYHCAVPLNIKKGFTNNIKQRNILLQLPKITVLRWSLYLVSQDRFLRLLLKNFCI